MSNEKVQATQSLEGFGYEQKLNRIMKLPSVIFFGIAYISPMTIFGTYGLVTEMTHGMLSLTYTFATLAMMFTAMSYRHMVKAYPIAGSVYTYTQRSINPHVGFIGGWGILLDYILLPMFNFVSVGLYMNILIPQIPCKVWIFIFIVIVAVINLLGMNVTKLFTNGLIIAQLIFLVAVLIFTLKWILGGGGLGTVFDFSAYFNAVEFNSPEVGFVGIFAGASIVCMSFLGFDSVTTVAEETIEPEKTIGRALLITCFAAGGTFILTSYLLQCAWPESWFSFENADTGAFEYMRHVIGYAAAMIFSAVISIGAVASAIASSTSAARILFGMGRDGLLPNKIFGYVNEKTKVPTYNIILLAVIALTALVLDLSAAASIVNFGALLGFIFVNISVISHYYIKGKNRKGTAMIKYLICPLIGAVVCAVIMINLDTLSKILGVAWILLGVILLAVITKGFKKLPPEMNLIE